MLLTKLSLWILGSAFIVGACAPKTAKLVSNADPTPHELEYRTKIVPILERSCKPCHFPDAGGKRRALNSYEQVTKNVSHILKRTQKDPSSKGFMPYKSKRDPLTPSEIQIIKDWAAEI